MKKPFSVGDRVRVYGVHTLEGMLVGRITKRVCSQDGWFFVELEPGHEVKVHPKQCRRLIKKSRRRVWVIEQDGQLRYGTWNAARFEKSEVIGYGDNCREIEFIEVRKPK